MQPRRMMGAPMGFTRQMQGGGMPPPQGQPLPFMQPQQFQGMPPQGSMGQMRGMGYSTSQMPFAEQQQEAAIGGDYPTSQQPGFNSPPMSQQGQQMYDQMMASQQQRQPFGPDETMEYSYAQRQKGALPPTGGPARQEKQMFAQPMPKGKEVFTQPMPREKQMRGQPIARRRGAVRGIMSGAPTQFQGRQVSGGY